MGIMMKVLSHEQLLALNESSIRARRRQNLAPEKLPRPAARSYTVNFHFEHEYGDLRDVRMSVILKPGVLTAWLDVSHEEFAAVPEVEMTELEWESAVCVGTPWWSD